jgi:glycine cleavage system protein P-like pyridoxal-binding family
MLRISTRFALTLATLLFGLLFVTPAAGGGGPGRGPVPLSQLRTLPSTTARFLPDPTALFSPREMSTPSFSPHIAGKHFTWLWR